MCGNDVKIKLCSYNIRYGLGLDNVVDLERIADCIRGHDIIALQEVERYWQHSNMTDQPAELGGLLPDYYWVYQPGFNVDASYLAEDRIVNRRRQHGSMILSRWPIKSSLLLTLPKIAAQQHFNMTTAVVEAVIETPQTVLRIYSVHLGSLSSRERLQQINHLLDHHRASIYTGAVWSGDGKLDDEVEARNIVEMNWYNGEVDIPQSQHTLLMGDFNCEPESPEYLALVGEKDASSGRVAYLDCFIDTWDYAKLNAGSEFTWYPAPHNRSPERPMKLDYCFASPSLCQHIESTSIDTAAKGSDHRPLYVELSL